MSYHLSHCTRSEMLLQQHLVLWQAQQTTVVALQLPSALLLYLNSIKTSWTALCSCTGFLLLKFRYWAAFTVSALILNEGEQRCTSPGSALLGSLRVCREGGMFWLCFSWKAEVLTSLREVLALFLGQAGHPSAAMLGDSSHTLLIAFCSC